MYCLISGVGVGGVSAFAKCYSFRSKFFFFVMGKTLTSEQSCTRIDLVNIELLIVCRSVLSVLTLS